MLRFGRGDIEYYMTGACPIFAIALHRLTGFPLAMLVDESLPFRPSAFSEEYPMIVHVFVLAPSGKAIDVRGLHSVKSLKDLYADLVVYDSRERFRPLETKVVEISLKELRGLMGGEAKPLCRYDAKEVKEAEKLAKRLLKEI